MAVKLLTAPAINSSSILVFKLLNVWAFKFSYIWHGSMRTKRPDARIFHRSKIRPVPLERSHNQHSEKSTSAAVFPEIKVCPDKIDLRTL